MFEDIFGCHNLGEVLLVTNAVKHPAVHITVPQTNKQNIWPKMSIVPKLRKSILE